MANYRLINVNRNSTTLSTHVGCYSYVPYICTLPIGLLIILPISYAIICFQISDQMHRLDILVPLHFVG